MSFTLRLAERARVLEFGDLPEATVHAARVSLADGLATMIAAARLEPATRPFHDHALAGGRGAATLLAGGTADASSAALANGALAHAIDFEDTFDRVGLHPNAALIPALLALAQERDLTFGELIAAMALGTDFACRLGLSMQSDPATRGWYFPPVIGCIGATFGAARLFNLTAEQTVSAISLAACQFSLSDELKRNPLSDLRAVRDGLAARAAVEAVLLAERGVIGTAHPLNGQAGLIPMLTGGAPDETAFDGFGETFLGEEVSIKFWPSCRGTHAAIAAALRLRDRVAPDDIRSVEATVRPPDDMLLLPVEDRQRPKTAIAAKFSIPYTFAVTMVRGEPNLDSFLPNSLGDAAVLGVAARVSMAAFGPDVEPSLRIILASGDERIEELSLPPKRLAGNIRFAELEPKFADCLGTGPESARLSALMNLETRGPESNLRTL